MYYTLLGTGSLQRRSSEVQHKDTIKEERYHETGTKNLMSTDVTTDSVADSSEDDSIVRDTVEAVETVCLELLQKVQTLMTILSHLIGKSPKTTPPSVSSPGISTFRGLMYGYGTSKQVSELSKWNNTSMCVHW